MGVVEQQVRQVRRPEPEVPVPAPGRCGACPARSANRSGWLADGQVRYREDVTDGLENVVEAFTGMLAGRNFGKALVRVS